MAVKGDYDQESVACCLSHLIELFTILGELKGHVALVGGWVPYFLCGSHELHTGSLDIDLALEFEAIGDDTYDTILSSLNRHGFVIEGLGKIRGKFLSPEHAGPVWVTEFMEIDDDEEIARVRRDAYEKVCYLLDRLEIGQYEGE